MQPWNFQDMLFGFIILEMLYLGTEIWFIKWHGVTVINAHVHALFSQARLHFMVKINWKNNILTSDLLLANLLQGFFWQLLIS